MRCPGQTEEERVSAQQKIETHLQRRLSCRPTMEELKQKNIIQENDKDLKTEKLKTDLITKVRTFGLKS